MYIYAYQSLSSKSTFILIIHVLTQVQMIPSRGKKSSDLNESLLMGTEIRLIGNGFCGTLGGFLPLPNGEIGALTCAHVLGVYDGVSEEDVSKIVIQPSVETTSDASLQQ